jgi:hypothetical protein
VNNYTNESVWVLPTAPARPNQTIPQAQPIQNQAQYPQAAYQPQQPSSTSIAPGGLSTPAYTSPVQAHDAIAPAPQQNGQLQQNSYPPQLAAVAQQSSYAPTMYNSVAPQSNQQALHPATMNGGYTLQKQAGSNNGQAQQTPYTSQVNVSHQPNAPFAVRYNTSVTQYGQQASNPPPQPNVVYPAQNVPNSQSTSYVQSPSIAAPSMTLQTTQFHPQTSNSQPVYSQPSSAATTYIHAPIAQKPAIATALVETPAVATPYTQSAPQQVTNQSLPLQQSSPPPAYTLQANVQSPQPLMNAPVAQQSPPTNQNQRDVHGQPQFQNSAPQNQQMYPSQVGTSFTAPLQYTAPTQTTPLSQAGAYQQTPPPASGQQPQVQQGMQQQQVGGSIAYYGTNGTTQVSIPQNYAQGMPQMSMQGVPSQLPQQPLQQTGAQPTSAPITQSAGAQQTGERGLVSDIFGAFAGGNAGKQAAGGKKPAGLAGAFGAGAGALLGGIMGKNSKQAPPQHPPAHGPPRPQGQPVAQGKPGISAGQAGLVGAMGGLALGALVGHHGHHSSHNGHGGHTGGHHNGHSAGHQNQGQSSMVYYDNSGQTVYYDNSAAQQQVYVTDVTYTDQNVYIDQVTYDSSYTDPSTGVTQDTFITDTTYVDSNGNVEEDYSETDVTYDTSGDFEVDTYDVQEDYSCDDDGGW